MNWTMTCCSHRALPDVGVSGTVASPVYVNYPDTDWENTRGAQLHSRGSAKGGRGGPMRGRPVSSEFTNSTRQLGLLTDVTQLLSLTSSPVTFPLHSSASDPLLLSEPPPWHDLAPCGYHRTRNPGRAHGRIRYHRQTLIHTYPTDFARFRPPARRYRSRRGARLPSNLRSAAPIASSACASAVRRCWCITSFKPPIAPIRPCHGA